MNIIVYGDEQNKLVDMIENCSMMQYRKLRLQKPEGYDDYLQELKCTEPEMIVISIPGAKGMEAVIAARNTKPEAALIWFTDDEAFGPQSYRLSCTYFTAQPVNMEIMEEAITRYYKAEAIG